MKQTNLFYSLLALGLEQFKNFPNGREIIQQLLLPTKTKKQISIRIKNLSARASKSNAVKVSVLDLTKTCPCNIQSFSKAKIENFNGKILIFL